MHVSECFALRCCQSLNLVCRQNIRQMEFDLINFGIDLQLFLRLRLSETPSLMLMQMGWETNTFTIHAFFCTKVCYPFGVFVLFDKKFIHFVAHHKLHLSTKLALGGMIFVLADGHQHPTNIASTLVLKGLFTEQVFSTDRTCRVVNVVLIAAAVADRTRVNCFNRVFVLETVVRITVSFICVHGEVMIIIINIYGYLAE